MTTETTPTTTIDAVVTVLRRLYLLPDLPDELEPLLRYFAKSATKYARIGWAAKRIDETKCMAKLYALALAHEKRNTKGDMREYVLLVCPDINSKVECEYSLEKQPFIGATNAFDKQRLVVVHAGVLKNDMFPPDRTHLVFQDFATVGSYGWQAKDVLDIVSSRYKSVLFLGVPSDELSPSTMDDTIEWLIDVN